MAEPGTSLDRYLVEFDDGLFLASVVARAAVELVDGGELAFPIDTAQALRPVCDRALATGAVENAYRAEFRSLVLDGWPESAFPITTQYDLAWSIVAKYRTAQLGDRPPDPRLILIQFPPRRPWPRR